MRAAEGAESDALPSPLWLVGLGLLLFGLVPWVHGISTSGQAAVSFVFLALGLLGLGSPLFRKRRRPFVREGDAWRVKGEDGELRALASVRFTPWETPAAAYGAQYAVWLEPPAPSSRGVAQPLLHAEDPAWLWNEAARYLPASAFVTTWGTGDLLARDPTGALLEPPRARMNGSPWSGRARIVRVLGVLLVVIAGAWLLFLGSSSAGSLGGFSVALAVAMWLLLAWCFVVVAFDRIVLEIGPELRVERRRLGKIVVDYKIAWSSLQRLESTAASRGVGHLLVVADRAFAVPLDAETRRFFAETLRGLSSSVAARPTAGSKTEAPEPSGALVH